MMPFFFCRWKNYQFPLTLYLLHQNTLTDGPDIAFDIPQALLAAPDRFCSESLTIDSVRCLPANLRGSWTLFSGLRLNWAYDQFDKQANMALNRILSTGGGASEAPPPQVFRVPLPNGWRWELKLSNC